MATTSLVYCSLCERTFESDSKANCKYNECNGGLGDIWDWEVVREINPGYPEIPESGLEYPLFGDRSRGPSRRVVNGCG